METGIKFILFLSAFIVVVYFLFIKRDSTSFKGILHGFEFNTIHRSALPCEVINAMDRYCDEPDKCSVENLPQEFDCRKKWPDRITQALNQKKCGSCWSFAITTAMSDRIRIHSTIGKNTISFTGKNWEERVHYDSGETPLMNKVTYPYGVGLDNISPYTFAGCDVCELAENLDPRIKEYFKGKICNQCCDGGVLQYACIYAMIKGCISYGSDPEPNDYTCSNYTGEPEYKMKSVYHIQGEKNIMANIFHNGPVICGYMVTSTFGFPQGKIPGTDIFGVPDQYRGGHAVCIIGWGEEKGHKYWLCRNSWGSDWNGDGCFKITRGQNFSGIEEDVWGFTPFSVYSMEKGPNTSRPKLQTCEYNSGGVVNPR